MLTAYLPKVQLAKWNTGADADLTLRKPARYRFRQLYPFCAGRIRLSQRVKRGTV